MPGLRHPISRRLADHAASKARSAVSAVHDGGAGGRARISFAALDPEDALRIAYEIVLQRAPDPVGAADLLPRLKSGQLTRDQLVEHLIFSEEFRSQRRASLLGPSLHMSRCDFIRGLPRARRVLDLGGTHQSNDDGALVGLGYPYDFDEVVIVDLPPDDRHPIYRSGGRIEEKMTPKGMVRYRYHSMTDLSGFDDASFDLVYSGESIEHINESEADIVLDGVFRVLRPGGHLALDTPNARVTRLQQAELIDPDHKIEYTVAELVAKIEHAGLRVTEMKGLNYAGRCLADGRFSVESVASSPGIYDEAEECYLIACLCQKPAERLRRTAPGAGLPGA